MIRLLLLINLFEFLLNLKKKINRTHSESSELTPAEQEEMISR